MNALFVFPPFDIDAATGRSEEHTSVLQSRPHLVCRLLLEKKNNPARHRAFTSFLHSYGAQPAAHKNFSYRGQAVAELSICWTQVPPAHRASTCLVGTLAYH